MKRFRVFLSSIGSLGAFGVILFLITFLVVVTWGLYGSVEMPYSEIHHQLTKLNLLEDDVRYFLLELDINADYYEFSGGDDYYVEAYENIQAVLKDVLRDVENEIDPFSEKEIGYLNAIMQALDAHQSAFDELLVAVGAEDLEVIDSAQASLSVHAAQAETIITDWTFLMDTLLDQAAIDAEMRARTAVMMGVFALISMPLLAYWAFIMAGQITHPILNLTNAVVAIQGENLLPGSLDSIVERKDSLGQLALDLEALSGVLNSRHRALENELEDLQQQIKDQRRRRRS